MKYNYKKYISLFLTGAMTVSCLNVVSGNESDAKESAAEENVTVSIDDVISDGSVSVGENTSSDSTTEDTEDEVKYSVPIRMVQAANPKLESMGNGALDGNAVVTIKDGKSVIELKFKAVTLSGLYGHLLNLWSYPEAESMDYSWWGDSNYEIPAEVTEYYEDYGMEYTSGNTEMYSFPRAMRIERNGVKEEHIFIRVDVDAMGTYNQAARLDFDWDEAEIIEDEVTETIVSAPVISVNKTYAENSEKVTVEISCGTDGAEIYYTTDGSEPDVNSQLYEGSFVVEAPSAYGGQVDIKAVAVKEGLVNSAVAECTVTFAALEKAVVAENEDIDIKIEAITGSLEEGQDVSIEEIKEDDSRLEPVTSIINNANSWKAVNLDFELAEDAEPLLLIVGIEDFDAENTKLYRITDESTYEEVEFTLEDGNINAEITEKGIYIIADSKTDSGSTDVSDDIENGKYWMTIGLWNANIDQESMGDVAFENNREALVTVNDGTALVEIATNPVSVSGYTSALKDIQSSEVDINILSKSTFTTNTKYDGTEHTFDYVTKFSFETSDMEKEYINVQISVPYTPMDGISVNDGGWISARLKLNWSSMEEADDSAVLTPDSSSASGSSSSSGGAVSEENTDTGIKIEADEFVFEDGTEFEIAQLTEGETYETAKAVLGSEYAKFRLFNIAAVYEEEEVQPSGQVKIYIPVLEDDGEAVEIYRITEETKTMEAGKTLLEYELSDDGAYYIITVKELGLFAVAEKEVKGEIAIKVEDVVVSGESVVKNEYTFSDTENHWARENIITAVKLGILKGVSENEFAPNDKATRAMVISVLGRLDEVSELKTGDNSFTDVNIDDYFYPYVVWGVEKGIVSGISNEYFGSYENITREQFAVMLYKFAKSLGIEFKNIYSLRDFSDSDNISSWAVESVNTLVRVGIITGRADGTFDPKGSATRAEIATMLVNFIKEYMPEKLSDTEESNQINIVQEDL